MSKGWKITTIVLGSLLALIFIFLGVYYLWPWNKSFFDTANKEFEIPGLDTKFTPQGMTVIDGSDDFLICGYMTDGSPSRFYLINDGSVSKYFTLKQSGEDYVGHSGGVVSKGNSIWVVGDKNCYRFSLNDVQTCENGGNVTILDSFETKNGADFVFENDGLLWVGEFYKKGKYETGESHQIKTRSGETNNALVFGYEIDETQKYGIENQDLLPEKVLSIRGLAQGIAMALDGRFVMSTSYGLADSKIYVYKSVLNEEKHDTITINTKTIDMWFLDNEALLKTISVPSMSEELVIKNNRVYLLFESGAKKYKIFNRKRLSNVYSFDVDNI